MRELDEFEDELIERFTGHPVLANLAQLPDDDFARVLLQRRFVSLGFTPAYDLAIDLLRDEAGLRIARVILREEYPDSSGHTRSHREDLRDDLLALGITRETIVEARPTAATRKALDDTFELIADAGRHEDADLRLLTILRFWGEVLVSVEYGRLWDRMAPVLARDGENRSRFYFPHHMHDAKARSLTTVSLLSSTHSDRLATRVTELLQRRGSTDTFLRIEQQVLELKLAFYDQFLPALDRVTT